MSSFPEQFAGQVGRVLRGEPEPRPDRFHPGEYLRDEILARQLPSAVLAVRMCVSDATVDQLLAEEIPVTPDLAERIGRALETSPGLWLKLQQAYDAA